MITLDVTLTGVHGWAWRQRLGIWIIRVAAFVMGCDSVQVELEDWGRFV